MFLVYIIDIGHWGALTNTSTRLSELHTIRNGYIYNYVTVCNRRPQTREFAKKTIVRDITEPVFGRYHPTHVFCESIWT